MRQERLGQEVADEGGNAVHVLGCKVARRCRHDAALLSDRKESGRGRRRGRVDAQQVAVQSERGLEARKQLVRPEQGGRQARRRLRL